MAMRTGGFFTQFKRRQARGVAPINVTTADIRAQLIVGALWGTPITAVTNASPAVITAVGHGLTTGQRVLQLGVGGATGVNGMARANVIDADTYSLVDIDTGLPINTPGVYTSGGRSINIDSPEFLSSIPSGDRGASSGAMGSVDFNAQAYLTATSPIAIASVAAETYRIVLFRRETGDPATDNLIAFQIAGTNLPIVVGSGSPTVNVALDSLGIGQL